MKEERKAGPRTVKEVLRIIRAAEQNGRLEEGLTEEFAGEKSMLAIWECREYFYGLEETVYEKNQVLLAVRTLLAAMSGNLSEAKQYCDRFGETSEKWDAQNFTQNDYIRMVTELVMPYITDKQFWKRVFFLVQMKIEPIQSLTLSAGRPSILNGFRDFSRYGRMLIRYKEQITEAVRTLYGSSGKGVYEIVLAEWYYQKNDCFDALVLVTGTIPLVESENDMRCLFVAMVLQMKILLMNGQIKIAEPLVDKIRRRIRKTGWEELSSSLDAMECLIACYDGRKDKIAEWMEKYAPDENKDIYMMDMYAYLVKIRCYLQTGRHMLAHVLVKQLIALLVQGNRHMDLCECYMLSAMTFYKAGHKKQMCEELERSLELARKYQYLRLLADEGDCMVQMLSIYRESVGTDSFTEEILKLAGEVGRQFPHYLKTPVEYYKVLTPMEKTILSMMAQGKTNDEIADNLGKKVGTVKFHSANIYKKLQVQNRQQAVLKGREIGLL